jgi:hypothetical protein
MSDIPSKTASVDNGESGATNESAVAPVDGVDMPSDLESMTFLQTAQSVLWAMLGVQSKRNASRDFGKGKLSHFIILGLFFTLIFIFTLVSIIGYVIGDIA